MPNFTPVSLIAHLDRKRERKKEACSERAAASIHICPGLGQKQRKCQGEFPLTYVAFVVQRYFGSGLRWAGWTKSGRVRRIGPVSPAARGGRGGRDEDDKPAAAGGGTMGDRDTVLVGLADSRTPSPEKTSVTAHRIAAEQLRGSHRDAAACSSSVKARKRESRMHASAEDFRRAFIILQCRRRPSPSG